MKLCERCHQYKAEVPDRNRMGRPIKRLCRRCHSDELIEDLLRIEADIRQQESADEQ